MTVLITGANRGIGRGLYDHYRTNGVPVMGTSRAGAAPFQQLDVCDSASLAALGDRLQGTALDLLICNAGVYLDKAESLETGYAGELWAQTFATNVAGVFRTVQSLLPNLRRVNAPKIAIISSRMASHERAPGGSYIYRASKAAVLNLGRNLATDLHNDGIAVGIYDPGWVVTDMGGSGAEITVAASVKGLSDRFAELSKATTGCFRCWDGRPQSY
ncbi:MAG: SDR family NAD(P)-dependent oxidoreductase [Paracoccaceae bacterium]